jgi:hypothetical protein
MQCSLLKVNRHFGGTITFIFRVELTEQVNRVLEARYLHLQGLFDPEDGDVTFNGLHGVISQKIVLFSKLPA